MPCNKGSIRDMFHYSFTVFVYTPKIIHLGFLKDCDLHPLTKWTPAHWKMISVFNWETERSLTSIFMWIIESEACFIVSIKTSETQNVQ